MEEVNVHSVWWYVMPAMVVGGCWRFCLIENIFFFLAE